MTKYHWVLSFMSDGRAYDMSGVSDVETATREDIYKAVTKHVADTQFGGNRGGFAVIGFSLGRNDLRDLTGAL
jgi:hypothetical protein